MEFLVFGQTKLWSSVLLRAHWDGEANATIIQITPPKKQIPKAGGQKGRGSGGRNFCPPTHRAEGAAGVGAFPQFCD